MAAVTGFDDDGGFTTWRKHDAAWHRELAALIPLEVDLEFYAGVRTPTIHQGVNAAGVLAYRKRGARGAYRKK